MGSIAANQEAMRGELAIDAFAVNNKKMMEEFNGMMKGGISGSAHELFTRIPDLVRLACDSVRESTSAAIGTAPNVMTQILSCWLWRAPVLIATEIGPEARDLPFTDQPSDKFVVYSDAEAHALLLSGLCPVLILVSLDNHTDRLSIDRFLDVLQTKDCVDPGA